MGKRLRVLVVDDSEISRELSRLVLENEGHEVHCIESAIGLTRHVAARHPDVVVIDLEMPALTGDRAVEVMRRHSRHRCAVVLHSDQKAETLRALCASAGADEFAVKDGDGSSLAQAVRRAALRRVLQSA